MSEYAATDAIGPRLPVVNRRVSPTESGEYLIRTDIMPIIEDTTRPNIGVCRLFEAPVTAYGGAGMVVKDYDTAEVWAGAATWPPGNKTFFVAPYLGRMYFNLNQIGSRVSATYAGSGSLIDADDMNHVNNKATSAALPFESIIVPANGQVIMTKRVAVMVFGQSGGMYIPNPAWASIEVHDPLDTDVYRSIIKNNTAVPQTALVKTFQHHRKDQ